MLTFQFRKSPAYERTVTWAESWGYAVQAPSDALLKSCCYFESIRDGEWFLEREQYPFLRIEFMLEGSLRYRVDGKKALSRQGDVFLTPAGHSVRVESTETRHCRRIGLECTGSLLENILHSMEIPVPGNITLPDAEKAEHLFRHTGELMKQSLPQNASLILGNYFALFGEISSGAHPEGNPPVPEPFQDLLSALHADPGRPWTLQEMCRKSQCGIRALNAFFRKRYQTTPGAYAKRCRLEQAALLLRCGGKSVKETAAELGFRNQYYFSRAYSAAFGHPPSKA